MPQPEQNEYIVGNEGVLQEIPNDTNQILKNLNIVIRNQAEIKVSLDNLAKAIGNLHINKQENSIEKSPPTQETFTIKPLETEAELSQFEKNLESDVFFQKVVEGMKFICGYGGKANGTDCCYKLIDFFLTRDFVTLCSWTGNTKKDGETKVPLKFFKNFKSCFLKLIILADKNFTDMECDKFFKTILKNSKQRTDANKIVSSHKTRPKNLKYKKRVKVPTTENEIQENQNELVGTESDENTNG